MLHFCFCFSNFLNSQRVGISNDDIDELFKEIQQITVKLIIRNTSKLELQDGEFLRKSLFLANYIIQICLSEASDPS